MGEPDEVSVVEARIKDEMSNQFLNCLNELVLFPWLCNVTIDVRLVNRKGRVFARSRLRYPELGKLPPLLDELAAGCWVGAPNSKHALQIARVDSQAQV